MLRFRALGVLLILGALAGCSDPQENTATEPATAAAAPAAPAPAPISQRMLGRWPMSLKSAVAAAPAARRANSMTMYYSVSREEPTPEELDAAGIPVAAQLGIYLMRAKLAAGESNARTVRVLRGVEQVRSHLPIFEFLPGNVMKIYIGGEAKPATYTVTAETPESLTIRVVEENDTDGPETFVITMQGDDVLMLNDPTDDHDTMTLAREGTGDPLNAPQVSPVPTGEAVPSGLVGRWKASGRRGLDVEFRANNDYVLHARVAIEGHFWVTEANGNQITIRRQMASMPHQLADTIEIVLDGDSLSWHDVASDRRLQMTRQ
ncbi:MAG: hypothetical protein GXP55_22165 [Deltaproteobacteria bacterium]|nr:hypothetical protein [Deltaproteobacteria bacterium]